MEEEKTDKPKRSRLRTLILIFLALSLLATGGGVAYWFWLEKQSISTDVPKEPVIEKVDPVYVPLNTFTVSLKPTEEEADRVLYLGITVSFIDSQSSATLAKFMPEYRSRLFMLFTQQTYETLSTDEGKHQLIAEIQTALSQPLPHQQAITPAEVLINEFILR
ncbi:flagellar basal body-associated FliL family protein [Enterobacter cancerogenus]|uniref:flagellar basal body-associated FliL family protein n=1 Tax=Enterobacter cancerogenus TaxID=69218 RepID=UPI0005388470|nr:flagellar basal body-associated FliL family protein [Enterobacter cancerogenus]KGT89711.1 hypothetical protein NH00_13970 [Enterobacter cancerogenus]